MENARGPIATTYDDLQALPLLREAKRHGPATATAPEAVCITLAQCIEVLLLNNCDLFMRAAGDLSASRWSMCAAKMRWARDFNRVLCILAGQLVQLIRMNRSHTIAFALEWSPSLDAFIRSIEELEVRLVGAVSHVDRVLETGQPERQFEILDLFLVCSHEMSMWSELLPGGEPANVDELKTFGYELVRKAVFTPQLRGDTFFMQFRACHQVPELLIWTANEFYLLGIQHAHVGDMTDAAHCMLWGNELLDAAIIATSPVVGNLTINDYHRIRANLGVTSGSHSHAIHVVLLTAVGSEIVDLLSNVLAQNESAGLLRHLCEQFRTKLQAWRNLHALLPKRNLGARGTKSLIGSPEAVAAVETMRKRMPRASAAANRLNSFLAEPNRVYARLLEQLGNITNARFTDVQERSGIFAPRGKTRIEE